MGHTIYYREHVTPKIITVQVLDEPRMIPAVYEYPEGYSPEDGQDAGVGTLITPEHLAPESWHPEDQLNIPAEPVYPATFGRLIWRTKTLDVYSEDPRLRAELWEDAAGTATYADIIAVFPELPVYVEIAARNWGAAQLGLLAAPYTERERETWHVQQREAEAWLVDPIASVPMITSMAADRGITISDLVDKIMGNVNAFRVVSGSILGKQQKLIDRAYGATSLDELLSVSDSIGIDLMMI